MEKIFVQNLTLMVTDKCNLDCQHCMRGRKDNVFMSDKTIENIFDQIDYCLHLSLCGGEPLLALKQIKKIIETIIEKRTNISRFGISTNGTHYTKEVDKLLDELENYCIDYADKFLLPNEKHYCHIDLSWNRFAHQELLFLKENDYPLFEKYVKNINNLRQSKYFGSYRSLGAHLYDEGNAKELHTVKSQLVPMKKYWTTNNDMLYFGPELAILNDGTVSEKDGNFDELKADNSYGNINNQPLSDILQSAGKKCRSLKKFNKLTQASVDSYYGINKK